MAGKRIKDLLEAAALTDDDVFVVDKADDTGTKKVHYKDMIAPYSNPNLLDNWYFADPIDQRQGYVVPPDTQYYSDTGLATPAGTVSAYTAANPGNGTYGSITVSGTTYYVPWSAAVRGYVGQNLYTIDRWTTYNTAPSILVEDSQIRLHKGVNQFAALWQHLEGLPAGTYTMSVLFGNQINLGSGHIAVAAKDTESSELLYGNHYPHANDLISSTFTTTVSLMLLVDVAVIVASPQARAVRMPSSEMEAISGSSISHVSSG